jgi:fumarylacetoacetase
LIDIELEVLLQSSAMRAKGMHAARITGSGFARAAYWTLAQMVTHHTVNGCNLRTGDLLGTGTLSGPSPDEAGSMLELSAGGARKFPLPGGEERTFLENGDAVVLRARCTREGFRAIGFGECQARVAS